MTDSTTLSTGQAVESADEGSGQSLIQRIRLLCALTVSGLIFWYVGWWVTGPPDPQGPVSLLLLDRGVVSMAELLGLAIVAGGLAVAICGARSSHRGPLAVAVGLATLAARGARLDVLISYRLTPPSVSGAAVDPFPITAFIAESWLWLALIAVGFVVGRWVESWFGPPSVPETKPRMPIDGSAELRQGLGAMVVICLVAWTAISFTAGDAREPILIGQVYFSIALAFLLGAFLAQWLFRVPSRAWLLPAVALVAGFAYVYGAPPGAVFDAAQETGTYVNLTSVVRPLPIEYAAMGSVGSIIGFNLGLRLQGMQRDDVE